MGDQLRALYEKSQMVIAFSKNIDLVFDSLDTVDSFRFSVNNVVNRTRLAQNQFDRSVGRYISTTTEVPIQHQKMATLLRAITAVLSDENLLDDSHWEVCKRVCAQQ